MTHVSDTSNLTTNAEGIATLFGVGKTLVYDWSKQGLPKAGRGKYYVKDAILFNLSLDSDKSEDLKKLRGELIKAQKENVEMRNASLRSELVERQTMMDIFQQLASMLTEVIDVAPTWCEKAKDRALLKERADVHRKHIERRIRDLASSVSSRRHPEDTAQEDSGAVGKRKQSSTRRNRSKRSVENATRMD